VVAGTFDPEFLTLPGEVLSTVMRHHQNYFSVTEPGGKLAPEFVAVMNIPSDPEGFVRRGNERVLRARFNDARFFWETDQKKTLAERKPDLAHVTFQAKLGSVGDKVGINQIVWDPASKTLFAESDELLEQHTRYALIITRGIRDPDGQPVESSEQFERFRHDLNLGQTHDPALKEYRKDLLSALEAARQAGVAGADVVTASVFTTQSATAILEKIRDQLHAAT